MNPMFHTLYLEATRKCNFACINCSSGSQYKDKIEEDLSYDNLMYRILIPARKLGTKNIDFSGGEFLLREDAFDILAKTNELGFSIGILSNGSTLTEKVLNKIDKIYVDYFGGGDAKYYLGEKFVPWNGTKNSKEFPKGNYLAVSATFLQGGRGEPVPGFNQSYGHYRWLYKYEPIAKIGYSIFVYYIE